MNFTTTITERDKKLLLFVGVVGFAVLFVLFMLLPGLSALNTAKADLAAAEALRSDMEYSLALAPAAGQNAAAAKNDLSAAAARFYPLMQNEDLDSLITGLELGHGLNPLALRITSAQPQALTGYIASPRAGETAAAAADTNPGSTDAAADAGFLYSAAIACTAGGTRESFIALLDDLAANYPAIQLTDFSITDSSYLTENEGVQTTSQFSFALSVYMCDKEALH